MAAPAYRTQANTTYARRANTSIAAWSLTALATGDIMIMQVVLAANAGAAPDGTFPAGWTQIGTDLTVFDGSFRGRHKAAWKRAASESGSYVFTHSTCSAQMQIGVYSGCIASGDPIDANSQQAADSGGLSITAPSVTTTVADTKLLFIGHDWNLAARSPPSGMTERFESLLYLADQDIAAIGATGTRTQTQGSSDPYSARLIAIKPAAGGGSQTITPSLLTNTETIYSPTVSRGAISVVPSLLTDPDTLYAPVVTRGALTVTPGLLTDPDTLYGPVATMGAISAVPALLTNAQTFYGPVVAAGSITIAPGLLTNTPTLFSPTASLGALAVTPNLLTNSETFYGPVVDAPAGNQTVTMGLLTNAQTFYGPVVAPGAISATPDLHTNTPVIHQPTVALAALTVTPALLTDADTFYGPVVALGSITVGPGLLTNPNFFYGPTAYDPEVGPPEEGITAGGFMLNLGRFMGRR